MKIMNDHEYELLCKGNSILTYIQIFFFSKYVLQYYTIHGWLNSLT